MKTALILSMTVLAFSTNNNYEDLLRKATDSHTAEDFKAAFTYSQEILKINPNDPFAHYYTAEYYGFETKFNKAYEHYTAAIDNNVSYPSAYYMRAVTDLILNKNLGFCSDIKVVNEIIEEDPVYSYLREHEYGSKLFIYCDLYEYIKTYDNSAAELNYNGAILADNGFYDGAQLFFNQAITENPEYDMAYFNLSVCFQGTEKEEEYLLKTIEINPNNDGAYRNLAQYYWDIGTDELKEKALSYWVVAANLGNEPSQIWLEDNGYNWDNQWSKKIKLPQGMKF